jgi:hypothetical protein
MKNRHNLQHRCAVKTEHINQKLVNLSKMPMLELWVIWDYHFKCRPAHPNRRHLESRLAYRFQEQAFGGIPIATQNFLIEIGEQFSKIKTSHHQSRTLLPGSTLLREFDGQQYCAQVVGKNQFVMDGQIFKSLSAIAQMISGTNVCGHAWFGLAKEQQS